MGFDNQGHSNFKEKVKNTESFSSLALKTKHNFSSYIFFPSAVSQTFRSDAKRVCVSFNTCFY